jgi:death-on-curing protein
VSRYLSVNEVIEINAEMVSKFGGIHGLRDSGALQSAVGRLESGYYADVIEEAAALFESLSQNHPFLDGNKRTAITATGVFLLLNGHRLLFDDVEAYKWLIGLYETERVSKATIEPWLRQHAEKF